MLQKGAGEKLANSVAVYFWKEPNFPEILQKCNNNFCRQIFAGFTSVFLFMKPTSVRILIVLGYLKKKSSSHNRFQQNCVIQISSFPKAEQSINSMYHLPPPQCSQI